MVYFRLRCLAFALATAAALIADAAASPPERYRDGYITVHAGIPDAGTRPLHIGDVLTFVLVVEFDAGSVQPEALDEVFFQRAFADAGSFRAYAPPQLTSEDAGGGRTRISARWRFQILDCPKELDRCPGAKRYKLPAISLSYQIIDASRRSVNSKSARFYPWPDRLELAPAISAADDEQGTLSDYLPGGAYAAPQPFGNTRSAGLATAVAGSLVLLMSIGAGFRRRERRHLRASQYAAPHGSRWEQLYVRLQDDDTPDERWPDHLRRCVTWYCQDELNRNPCGWLRTDAPLDAGATDQEAEWRSFYFDVLQLETVRSAGRAEILTRMAALARLASADSRASARD